MTTARYLSLIILIITKLSCKMENSNFEIYGNEELIKHSKINIVKIDDNGNERQQTLLFFGKTNIIKAETEVGATYKVYISYKDSLVNVLQFENVMRYANDHINRFYMIREKDYISVLYIGRKANLNNKEGFRVFLIPTKDFFKLNAIEDKEDKNKYKKLFFTKF